MFIVVLVLMMVGCTPAGGYSITDLLEVSFGSIDNCIYVVELSNDLEDAKKNLKSLRRNTYNTILKMFEEKSKELSDDKAK